MTNRFSVFVGEKKLTLKRAFKSEDKKECGKTSKFRVSVRTSGFLRPGDERNEIFIRFSTLFIPGKGRIEAATGTISHLSILSLFCKFFSTFNGLTYSGPSLKGTQEPRNSFLSNYYSRSYSFRIIQKFKKVLKGEKK